MKKIILMAAFLSLGVSQVSCNKDDDNELTLPAATLTGKWNYAKDGGIVGGTEVLVDYDGNEPGCDKDFILINADNTIVDVDFDSFDTPCEQFSDAGTYNVSGNTIVVDFGDGPQTAEILNLSYTELKIKTDGDYIQVFTRG